MIIKFQKKALIKNQPTFLLSCAPRFFAALLVLFPLCYFFVDKPLACFFEKTSADMRGFFMLITHLIDPLYYFILAPAAFFWVRFRLHKEAFGNRLLLIALAVPLSVLATDLLKVLCGRDRPELLFLYGQYGFHLFAGMSNAEFSFPSGHACTAGAIMASLACFYPKRSWYYLLLAFLLAFSRVGLTQHYLSDILAGVLIGLVVAQGTYCAMKKEKFSF